MPWLFKRTRPWFALGGLFCLAIGLLLFVNAESRWQRYKREHNCSVLSRAGDAVWSSVPIDDKGTFTWVYSGETVTYLCDDGTVERKE